MFVRVLKAVALAGGRALRKGQLCDVPAELAEDVARSLVAAGFAEEATAAAGAAEQAVPAARPRRRQSLNERKQRRKEAQQS